MRHLIRKLAQRAGVSTAYHVAASYPTAQGQASISMTVTITPWIHQDNYRDVVDYVKSQAAMATETPCITSITKLGA